MEVSFDKIVDAAYLRYSNEQICKTVEFNEFIYIDYDKHGKIVGIEVLNVSTFLEEKRIQKFTEKRKNKIQDKLVKDFAEFKNPIICT